MSNVLAPARSLAAAPTPLAGIALAIAGFALFTVMDAAVKLLGQRYHVVQILALNAGIGFVTVCLIAHLRGGIGRLRTARGGLHLARWVISFVGTLSVFYAYTRMPIADVYAILFTAPLIITTLSAPLLGETVGWRRWIAILAGFAGVLVMLQPGGAGAVDPTVAALALLGALAHAGNMLLVRKLGRTELPESFGFYGNFGTCLASILLLVGYGATTPVWVTPVLADLPVILVAGLIGGSGFCLLAAAFRHAPAALVAPFQYAQMPFGLLVGWLLFGTAPEASMLLGASIVVASGLYTVGSERRSVPASSR